ncbi:MAG: hypothetical protein ACFFCP_06105 [Promethearchaeota archaeon]
MEDIRADLSSVSEDELRASTKRKMKFGGLLCVVAPLLPIVIFLIQYRFPGDSGLLFILTLVVIGFLGAAIIIYYGMGSSLFFRGMKILRQISPPEPIIEGKFAVLNKDPVYAIAQWGSNVLFFVAFYESERTFDKKVNIPKMIWIWEYSHPIGDIKIARREDVYTIPVGEGVYYSGRGILYALLVEKGTLLKVRIPLSFTAEQLNQIVDALTKDASTYGSSSQFLDDDSGELLDS